MGAAGKALLVREEIVVRDIHGSVLVPEFLTVRLRECNLAVAWPMVQIYV